MTPTAPDVQRVAAIVLAGGRASRLGQSKPRAVVGGEALLIRSVRAVAAFPTVVVGPPDLADLVADRPRLALVRESPAFGGPVAALSAGYSDLEARGAAAEWMILLACDIPRASEAVARLLDAVRTVPDSWDGACLRADERAQWLCGVYRSSALGARLEALRTGGGVDSASMGALLGALELLMLADVDDLALDVDTPEDLLRANERIPA